MQVQQKLLSRYLASGSSVSPSLAKATPLTHSNATRMMSERPVGLIQPINSLRHTVSAPPPILMPDEDCRGNVVLNSFMVLSRYSRDNAMVLSR